MTSSASPHRPTTRRVAAVGRRIVRGAANAPAASSAAANAPAAAEPHVSNTPGPRFAIAGIAENSRFAPKNSTSAAVSSRSPRSRLRRKRPYINCAASSEISAAAVSTATCNDGLRYAKRRNDVTLTSSVNAIAQTTTRSSHHRARMSNRLALRLRLRHRSMGPATRVAR